MSYIPVKAIETAIQGGWIKELDLSQFGEVCILPSGTIRINFHDPQSSHDDYFDYDWERIALDPLFFQALGKALGWDPNAGLRARIESVAEYFGTEANLNAHRFYDLILEGKDTADYWKELLN